MEQSQYRSEPVVLETERHRISGLVTLARDGYRSRITDLLNAGERDFLPLTDATIERLDGGAREQHPYLAVAKRHIVLASHTRPASSTS